MLNVIDENRIASFLNCEAYSLFLDLRLRLRLLPFASNRLEGEVSGLFVLKAS